MEKADQLREIIARLAEIEPASVTAGFSLNHRFLQGSAGRARLDAMVRSKLHMKSPAVYTANTFSELESAICGSSSSTVAPAPIPAQSSTLSLKYSPPPAGLLCGIDLESIDAMPPSEDYWTTPFYPQFFSPREIAYCVSQSEPRQHFAARWRAKEALKKCDPAFLSHELNTIEVLLEDSGRPFLRINHNNDWLRLPHAVSLSHTPAFATAIVIAASAEKSHAPQNPSTPEPTLSPNPPTKNILQKLLGK